MQLNFPSYTFQVIVLIPALITACRYLDDYLTLDERNFRFGIIYNLSFDKIPLDYEWQYYQVL